MLNYFLYYFKNQIIYIKIFLLLILFTNLIYFKDFIQIYILLTLLKINLFLYNIFEIKNTFLLNFYIKHKYDINFIFNY